jgi:pyruvate dehydrogenase E2 component (dihydrolipoamide acetyltransferase)
VYTDFQLSDLAQTLAARQTHAKQVVPHYYLSVDLNLAELLKARAAFNAQAAASKKKIELSVQDFLVKAAALAMHQVPDVNGSWMDTFVRRYEQVRDTAGSSCD